MTAPPLDSLTSDPSSHELVSIDVRADGPTVVVTAVGEIDSTSAPMLGRHLERLFDGALGEVEEFTVDLRGVTFLDSAGLCVLAAAHRRTAGLDMRMRVLASSRAVIRPLEITGLWKLLQAEQVQPEAPVR